MKKLLFILVFYSSLAHSQDEEAIFELRLPSKIKGKVIIQTGFICNKFNGVITSFHGIYESRNFLDYLKKGAPLKINVIHDNTRRVFGDINLIGVDLNNDIALISNSELDSLISNIKSYKEFNSKDIRASQKLIVIGHAHGLPQIERQANIGTPPLKKREDFFSSNTNRSFHSNETMQAKVLNIDGNFLYGNSGSPILSPKKDIIGIIEGGIPGSNISWGSLVSNWKFRPIHSFPIEKLEGDLDKSIYTEDYNIFDYGNYEDIDEEIVLTGTLYIQNRWGDLDGYLTIKENDYGSDSLIITSSNDEYVWNVVKYSSLDKTLSNTDYYLIETKSKIDNQSLFLYRPCEACVTGVTRKLDEINECLWLMEKRTSNILIAKDFLLYRKKDGYKAIQFNLNKTN